MQHLSLGVLCPQDLSGSLGYPHCPTWADIEAAPGAPRPGARRPAIINFPGPVLLCGY